MSLYSRFGSLIGVLHIGNSYCKFQVFATNNAEILTCHEIKLANYEGETTYDPIELWQSVQECIRIAVDNLIILDIAPRDIVAIGITNQRETSVLWHRKSGEIFSFAGDEKNLKATVSKILPKTKNKRNYLKSVCGLPISPCFSAIKIRYLIENNESVREAIENEDCCFGNLDSWILWNLTGGINNGVHLTDVTNASRTMLMNLQTLTWDARLCNFFDIPTSILPAIKSCSEIYGYLKNPSGPLDNIPIASVIGDQNASLIGHVCLSAGQIECTIDENCSVLFNTGQELVDSDNGLLTTVAFKLGPNQPTSYALEGFIGNAGAAINWVNKTIGQCDQREQNNNATTNIPPFGRNGFVNRFSDLSQITQEKLIFVPALKGLCAPSWIYQAKGFLSGLTINTTSANLLLAARESICFQTKTILDSLKADCKTWKPLNKLIVGGELSENVNFLQLLADLCNITIERPQVSTSISLGCMVSAALTMKNLSLEDYRAMCTPPIDTYTPTINCEVSEKMYMHWLSTVKTCLNVSEESEQVSKEEVNLLLESKNTTNSILNSIPGCVFLFSSYVIYVYSQLNPM